MCGLQPLGQLFLPQSATDWQQQKRCCQPGQIDTRDLTSLSARKGKPKLKHSMLVSLCVRSNNMFLYRLKYINGAVWLRRKKKKDD